MGNTVVVTLNGPSRRSPRSRPAGVLTMTPPANDVGITVVDATAWAGFQAIYADNPIITANAVYEV